MRAGGHAVARRCHGRRRLRGPRRLQASGPVERGRPRRGARRGRAGRRTGDEGAASRRQRTDQDRQPHGRGPRRGLARGRRALRGRDREAPGQEARLGRSPPHACTPPRTRSGLSRRSRPTVPHAGVRADRLQRRRAGTARQGRRAPRPHHARDGGIPRHLPRGGRCPHAGSAPARPEKRPSAGPRTGRFALGPDGRRDPVSLRRPRSRPRRARVGGLQRPLERRRARPRSPPASARHPTHPFQGGPR